MMMIVCKQPPHGLGVLRLQISLREFIQAKVWECIPELSVYCIITLLGSQQNISSTNLQRFDRVNNKKRLKRDVFLEKLKLLPTGPSLPFVGSLKCFFLKGNFKRFQLSLLNLKKKCVGGGYIRRKNKKFDVNWYVFPYFLILLIQRVIFPNSRGHQFQSLNYCPLNSANSP